MRAATPLAPLPAHRLSLATQMSSQKNVTRCILLRGISNIPHVSLRYFFTGYTHIYLFLFFLLGAKTKIFLVCAAKWEKRALQQIRKYDQGVRQKKVREYGYVG